MNDNEYDFDRHMFDVMRDHHILSLACIDLAERLGVDDAQELEDALEALIPDAPAVFTDDREGFAAYLDLLERVHNVIDRYVPSDKD